MTPMQAAFTAAMGLGTVGAAIQCIRGASPLLVLALLVVAYWTLGWLALAWWLDHVHAEERLRVWLCGLWPWGARRRA